jgi:curli biogenesis system outer membrane secretion channel CsgG
MFRLKRFCTALILFSFANGPAQDNDRAKPTVAVVDFEVKAPGLDRAAGAGMSEVLTNALFETGRYRVVDRSSMDKIMEEQKRVLWGSVDPASGAAIGKLIGAQYLVVGALLKLGEKEVKGGVLGIAKKAAGGAVGLGVLTFEAQVSISLKVINATTGEIMASKTVDKKKKSTGVAVGSLLGKIPVGGVVYKSKSMEDAMAEALQEAVALVNEQLPAGVASAPTTFDPATECANLTGLTAPKIMVVIPEVHITRRIPDPAGETEIIRLFVEANFNLVDQSQVAAIRNQEKVLNAVNDPALASSLGVEFGADVIIIGEAFSELAGNEKGMFSCRARVEARAIATRTGKILAADGQHASGLDISENVAAKTALRNAGGQIGRYFMQQLCKKMGDAEPEVTAIEIFLGSTNFKQLREMEKLLATVKGIKSIKKNLTGSVGRIHVEYEGNGEALADALMDAQTAEVPFEITSVSTAKIDVSMKAMTGK